MVTYHTDPDLPIPTPMTAEPNDFERTPQTNADNPRWPDEGDDRDHDPIATTCRKASTTLMGDSQSAHHLRRRQW